MKKIPGLLALLALLSLFVIACGGSSGGNPPSQNSSGTPATTGHTVNLAASTFAPNSITLQKGASITLQNQTANVHIVANGFWQGNTQDPESEAGAPVVANVTFSTANQSLTVGPFNTAGTFHYYCSVHPDMNLTVIVQ